MYVLGSGKKEHFSRSCTVHTVVMSNGPVILLFSAICYNSGFASAQGSAVYIARPGASSLLILCLYLEGET